MKTKNIQFICPNAISFSGQTAAGILAAGLLKAHGYEVAIQMIPAVDRTRPLTREIPKLICSLLVAWIRSLTRIARTRPILVLSYSQTLSAFVRIGVVHFVARIVLRIPSTIVTLHGNTFMTWGKNSRKRQILHYILGNVQAVTVLGERQCKRLIEWGIPGSRIHVVRNTTAVSPISEADCIRKHTHHKTTSPIELLHLSLLIESKGYPVYLDALEILAKQTRTYRIHAVLCGPISFSPHCCRFKDETAVTTWIQQRVVAINESERIRIEWIPGASGDSKESLLNKAQVFVLPTTFPVEAQPLALLEAMAKGCPALVSSAGEIPSTVTNDCAIVMTEVSATVLADALDELCMDEERRRAMGLSARNIYREQYSNRKHTEAWINLLEQLGDCQTRKKDS